MWIIVLVLATGLTLAIAWAIIKVSNRNRIRYFGKIVYSQSSIHNNIKDFIPKHLYSKPEVMSQSRKHVEKGMIKIIVIDGKAYWVVDNIFYTANTVHGDVIPETVKPVDTNNMSKEDIDKMLFILDNLDKGNRDDSSSSGN
jgi:hypothetical protein